MSNTYVSSDLRRLIVARAESICEYCLIAEDDTYFGCEADHIISEKHGGTTDAANLALACACCNQAKGSDIGSIHWDSNEFTRFFNPRTDRWGDHFELTGNEIRGLTPIGQVTARILLFNSGARLVERKALQRIGRFPSVPALKRMQI